MRRDRRSRSRDRSPARGWRADRVRDDSIPRRYTLTQNRRSHSAASSGYGGPLVARVADSGGRHRSLPPASQSSALAANPATGELERQELVRQWLCPQQEDYSYYTETEEEAVEADPEWEVASMPDGTKFEFSLKLNQARPLQHPSPKNDWEAFTLPDGKKILINQKTGKAKEPGKEKPSRDLDQKVMPPSTVQPQAKDPPDIAQQLLTDRISHLQTMADEAKTWQTAKAGSKSYWFKQGSTSSQWEMPTVVAEVAAPSFSQELRDLQSKLTAIRQAKSPAASSCCAPPPPPPPPPPPESEGFMTNPLPTQADWSKAVIKSKEEVQAEARRFVEECAKNNFSQWHSASYHVVFAQKFKDEDDVLAQAEAMGFRALEPGPDSVDMIPPFWQVNHTGNKYVPQWYLVVSRLPHRKLTLEYIASGKEEGCLSVRTSRSLLLQFLDLLILFFGRFANVSAQRGPKAGLPPKVGGMKKPRDASEKKSPSEKKKKKKHRK